MGPHFGFQIRDSSFAVGGEVDPEAGTASEPWLSLGVLLDDSGALVARYEQMQRALSALAGREIEFRVAASTGHLGLVARLICPAFAATLLGRRLDLSQAWWQPTVGGAMPLSLPGNAIIPAAPEFETSHILGLVERTAALSLSRQVLWGNVASAVNGAATTVAEAHPDLRDDAADLAASLVDRLDLTDTFVGQMGSRFRRRSCCLIYRIAPPGRTSQSYCGDCVLARPDAATNSKLAVP